MADRYIDYFEVSEYGSYFVTEAAALVGASELVNIPALQQRVSAAVEAVVVELEKIGIRRSDLRIGQADVDAAVPAVRKELERFYNFLGGLEDDVEIDRESFFSGDRLGNLAMLKPADLLIKLDEVLRGFLVPANAAVPERDKRKAKLEAVRKTLADALGTSSANTNRVISATAGLAAARERFLGLYNGVAKPLVRAMLADLGRADEYTRFFLDLQVDITEDDPSHAINNSAA
ncbi:MAG TPA: hypothetical protein VH877_19940 [Polyangia bacterium]|jgi:hypothetical protein|nr:hypothetical protein [Polyangia bacterium]